MKTGVKYIGKCLYVETVDKGEKRGILAVGDLHIGYEEVLNQSGVFISQEMFKDMTSYFDKVITNIDHFEGKVDYVVLLGDVKHDFGRILRQEWKEIMGLFDYFESKLNTGGKIMIVKGNHDKILEYLVEKKKGVALRDFFIVGEICFVHGDRGFEDMLDSDVKCWIMGHGHPAVKLSDGVKMEKYKCFLTGKYEGKEIIIVPSFLEYSEGSDPRENDLGLAWNFDLERFHVKIVGADGNLEVLDFGILKKL